MTPAAGRVIELQEYSSRDLLKDELDEPDAHAIWTRYRNYVDIDFPSPKTGQRWRLTPKGCVGFLPVGANLGLALRPKVPIANLFRMLEHAYRLDSFRFLDGAFACASLDDVYARLARELARRVLERVRRGLHRAYEENEERLRFLRGRFDVGDHLRAPWQLRFQCRFAEHTLDIEENQILAWALHVARRTITGPEETRTLVRRAYRALQGTIDIAPIPSSARIRRSYDRLTRDYAPMHTLSAFIIDHAGPQHVSGDRTMLPFVLDMNRLFEKFVSTVLTNHAGPDRSVVAQERVQPAGDEVTFVLDLLVRDSSGKAMRVIDTKYKDVSSPSPDDVAQVVAYATAVGATEAVLVYPRVVNWAAMVGPVKVRMVGLPLDGDVTSAAGSLAGVLLAPTAAAP